MAWTRFNTQTEVQTVVGGPLVPFPVLLLPAMNRGALAFLTFTSIPSLLHPFATLSPPFVIRSPPVIPLRPLQIAARRFPLHNIRLFATLPPTYLLCSLLSNWLLVSAHLANSSHSFKYLHSFPTHPLSPPRHPPCTQPQVCGCCDLILP